MASTSSRRTSSSSDSKSSKAGNGKLVLTFSEFDRETKNAIRFQEDLAKGQDRGDIGFVYILKKALERAGINPEAGIRVTVEELED